MAYTIKNPEGHESTKEWPTLEELLADFGPDHCEVHEVEGNQYVVWRNGEPTSLTVVIRRGSDGRLRGVLQTIGT